MSQPLFKIGERVGLVSKTFPERNGEYTVRQVLGKGDILRCRLSGQDIHWSKDRYVYILEESCEQGTFWHETVWAESALRKLHKPSKFSFEELLSEIKQCNMNTIEA